MGKHDNERRDKFLFAQQNRQPPGDGIPGQTAPNQPSPEDSSLPFSSPLGIKVQENSALQQLQSGVRSAELTNPESHIQEDISMNENETTAAATETKKAFTAAPKNKLTAGQVAKRVAMVGVPFVIGVAGAFLFQKFGPKISLGKTSKPAGGK